MHSLGHTRFTFGLLQLLVAAVCSFCSLGWGACTTRNTGTSSTDITIYSKGDCSGFPLTFPRGSLACTLGEANCDGQPYNFTIKCLNNGGGYGILVPSVRFTQVPCNSVCTGMGSYRVYFDYTTCDTQAEADSVSCLNAGNLWLDGACRDEQWVCENSGGTWQDGQCITCNDHVAMPDKCEELWKSGYNVDGDGNPGGGGYWAITTYECFYDSCAMSLNCQEKSSFPAGNLTCADFQDTSGTPGRCVGVMGYSCIIQCGNGSTIDCECDGHCERAMNNPACACASSSSTPHSSSSGGGSSSSGGTSSGETSSGSSSDSGGTSSGGGGGSSGSGGDWEYNYYPHLDTLVRNSKSMVGYLSDIDRQIAALNFQQQSGDNSAAIVAAVAEGTDAQIATKDTLHSMHGTLNRIDSALNQEVETEDYSGWISSASNMVNTLYSMAADTSHTLVSVDSVKADTSTFKSKYSGLFISNVYTREGCYTFTIKDSGLMGKIGKTFKLGASLDFGSVGGFDLCAILRGLVRACGAILCLLITIKAYRSAFSSSDG